MHEVEQEILTGQLRLAHWDSRRIDEDVVPEEVGQNGKAARSLHAKFLYAGTNSGLDERLAGIQFVGDLVWFLIEGTETDLNRHGGAGILFD